MKKSFILIVLAFAANLNVSAQNLTQQMFQLYKGQIKTLIQKVEGMSGEAKTMFDRNGKVLSYEQPDGKMEYYWNTDNSSVEIRGYANGQLQGSQMLYISEMTASRYKYEMGGVLYTVDFKSNGAVSKQTASMNGQTQTTFFYYKRIDDILPYKTVMSMGGQSMSAMIEIIEKDSYGNPTKFTQTANGQTITTIYEITYY